MPSAARRTRRLRGAAGAGARDPRAAQDALHGRTREHDRLALGEQLAEVRVVEAGVPVLGEGDHARGDLGIERVRRAASAVPVRERVGPVGDQARAEPTDRAIGEAEQERCLLAIDLALEQPREHEGALIGRRCHCPPSFPLPWVDRITEQLAGQGLRASRACGRAG